MNRPTTLHQNPNESPTTPRWVIDAGHGWLVVSTIAYPDALDVADRYCYVTGDSVALEEDRAATAWLRRHPLIAAKELTVIDWSNVGNGDANVRSWPRYVEQPDSPYVGQRP